MIESKLITSRLNQIDKLKARGVGDHISLPQLVVCGDQSAGKSSVLEGITEIPFPRKDGLCTRFATEIVLRHSLDEQSITASIIPDGSRDSSTADSLRAYEKRLSSYDELPDIIQEVGKLMGLRGFTDDEQAPPFTSDVLRIQVTGQTGLHLTIVDLPGLVSGADNEEKTLVENLVDGYLQNSRTIILAVIPAVSDVETQPIIRAARSFDKEGLRTVGIITKADLINEGTEARVATVMKNQGPIPLKLGYFLLKNPSPKELDAGITTADRREKELQLFQKPLWKKQGLSPDRVGIKSLRTFLQALLEQHIGRELPKVRSEIEGLLEQAKEQLKELGTERPNAVSQRLFLSKLSAEFHALTRSSVDGTYQGVNSDFFAHKVDGLSANRLRAHIHYLNNRFAGFMRCYGQKKWAKEARISFPTDETDLGELRDSSNRDRFEWDHPEKTSPEEYDEWVLEIYRNTKGLELPGNHGHTLLTELFHAQSSRWSKIARDHAMRVHRAVYGFVNRALSYTVKESRACEELKQRLKSSLKDNLDAALTELDKICRDEKIQPITYNHYFTDNIQKARQSAAKEELRKACDSLAAADPNNFGYSDGISYSYLIQALESHITVDMEEQACNEAKSSLKAYYKVAMKTFVDNVCRQVVERHIMAGLPTIFHPTLVVELSDAEVERIAGEPATQVAERDRLETLVQILGDSLDDLQD